MSTSKLEFPLLMSEIDRRREAYTRLVTFIGLGSLVSSIDVLLAHPSTVTVALLVLFAILVLSRVSAWRSVSGSWRPRGSGPARPLRARHSSISASRHTWLRLGGYWFYRMPISMSYGEQKRVFDIVLGLGALGAGLGLGVVVLVA